MILGHRLILKIIALHLTIRKCAIGRAEYHCLFFDYWCQIGKSPHTRKTRV